MPITITFEKDWAKNYKAFIESTYKVHHGTDVTYCEQIETCLKDLDDEADLQSVISANVLCKAFEYLSIKEIKELHVLKLITKDDSSLCIKIAAPHPVSKDICYVGSFVLNAAMNIIALDKVETVQRKVARLPLFKVAESSYHCMMFKENSSPNVTSQAFDNSAFMKIARQSYRSLPSFDELLAGLKDDQQSTVRNNSEFKP